MIGQKRQKYELKKIPQLILDIVDGFINFISPNDDLIDQSIIIQIFPHKAMFDICKTVKIYQINNHYHLNESINQRNTRTYQIQYQQNERFQGHNNDHLLIQSVNSQLIENKKGISVSLTYKKQNSPLKKLKITSSRKQLHSHGRQMQKERTEQLSQKSKLKYLSINSQQYDENNMFWSQDLLSPKLQSRLIQNNKQKEYYRKKSVEMMPENELQSPPQIRLLKTTTRTTNESLAFQSIRYSNPIIQPVNEQKKKSLSFLRSSNSKLDIKQSLINSIPRKDYISQSLLKLSSSFHSSQILQKNNQSLSQFQYTASVQIKKQDDFLKDYINNSQRSIYLTTQDQRQMKIVKSNKDLLKNPLEYPLDYSPSQSYIDDGYLSPVRKLKEKNKNKLLNIYDKETIISKQVSQNQKIHIDESMIVEHEIHNKFVELKKKVAGEGNIYLALEVEARFLVLIKQIPIHQIDRINNQLNIYKAIQSQGLSINVLKLFQSFMHNSMYMLIKQPFEETFNQFLMRNCQAYRLIGWEFVIKSVRESVELVCNTLRKLNIHLSRSITLNDLVNVMGEWKLHGLDMFQYQNRQKRIEIVQALDLLELELTSKIQNLA